MTEPIARGWYRVERATNAAPAGPTRAVVRIYDAIGGWFGADPAMFARDLDALDVEEIELRVNSPGGDVFDGLAIMNTLRAHPARVIAHVDGMAASAASFIVTGGADEVVMSLGSELMLHNPSGITVGNAALHRDTAARLDKIRDSIAVIYQRKAGGELADWHAVLEAETWYTAEEAVSSGLADRLDEDARAEPVANRLNLRFSAYAGRAHAPAPAMPGRTTPAASAAGRPSQKEGSPAVAFTDDQLITMRQMLGIAEDADENSILAALAERVTAPAEPPEPTPLPEGVVAIDANVLEDLRAAARRGEEARAQQESEEREQLVTAAMGDGRISPASYNDWINKLTVEPVQGKKDLASLAPGLIPVGAPIGHAGAPDGDDPLYTSVYGKEG